MLMKKDFKAIAEIIKNLLTREPVRRHPVSYYYGVRDVAEKLANYFAEDGQIPRFDQQKFLNACGL